MSVDAVLLLAPFIEQHGEDGRAGQHSAQDNCQQRRGTENEEHQQGGCMAPVQYLAAHGVNALLAGGMGMRPLMGFNQMGISVYFAGNQPTVGMAVQAFCQGKLIEFTPEHTCGGGH